MRKAPFRLLAIVNRVDLRRQPAYGNANAGEARFVYNVLNISDPGNPVPTQFNVIFEYGISAATCDDIRAWGQRWHDLGSIPFGESYNAALQAITGRFAGRGARPAHPNGSAINAVRTNEISFSDNGIWELRQFNLSPTSGRLEPATVDLTTDRSFNNSDTLAAFINANQAAIIAETHVVPAQFNGQPFGAGAIFNDLGTWFAPGVDNEARHHFALNTCNGCHSTAETGVTFLQISPRFPGTAATLSGFLVGTTVSDPVTGAPRTFSDLGRRKIDLQAIVCPSSGARTTTTLRKGIQRVH
jgi:hypothetical protein